MWTRAEVKRNAREKVKRSYGKVVIASIVLSIAIFGSKGSGGNRATNSVTTQEIVSENQTVNQDPILTLDNPEDFRNLIEQKQFTTLFGILGISMVVGELFGIFILHPLEIGARKNLLITTKQDPPIYELAAGFAFNYKNVIKTMFFRDLKLFLWTLLFLVPGIIKAYEYRMVPYLLAENPSIPMKEAFATSKKMMDGDKMNAFLLDLSFLGWNLVGVVTIFVASVFWVNPYYNMTNAELFVVLKEKIGSGLEFVPPLHKA